MQTTLKAASISISFLILGMIIFYLSRTLPLPPTPSVVIGILFCLIFYFASRAFLRYENTSIESMNLLPGRKSIARLGLGLTIGGVIAGTMLFALFSLTELNIEQNHSQSIFSFFLASMAIFPLALMEELLFRGYPFFRLTQLINIRWVILLTASFFALYHYNGSNDIISVFIGPGIWGVTFGVAAYLSKSIAVPLGIHISANWLQAIFGLKTQYAPIWTVVKTPEQVDSIIAIETLGLSMQIVLLLVTILVFELVMKRRRTSN
jgi:membrane protease YdiL (CAAX protease family)